MLTMSFYAILVQPQSLSLMAHSDLVSGVDKVGTAGEAEPDAKKKRGESALESIHISQETSESP